LLDAGADFYPNEYQITPVDMAGFCGHSEAVKVFSRMLKKKIDIEVKTRMANDGGN